MTLPAPNLDDRTFQDLVDEAKRMVQKRWPDWTGWTEHNVSDPGVTLIETFAYMVEQLIYRLNRVPDRMYVKFLDLIGIERHPPLAAKVDVTFWLTAPQDRTISVPEGTEAATEQSDLSDGVVFQTLEPLPIVPCRLVATAVARGGGQAEDRTDQIAVGQQVIIFSDVPVAGDVLYVGLSDPTPSCAVALRVAGEVEGYGIDPRRPPRRWEAWTGRGWDGCEVDRDDTGGFNRAGDIVLHVPAGHLASTIAGRRAGWLRCVVTEPIGDQPTYRASPRISRLEAMTIGGTVAAQHSQAVGPEPLGTSEGVPGQVFQLGHRPVVVGGEPEVIEVARDGSEESAPEVWERVDTFAAAGPDQRCFRLDADEAQVHFGPAIRTADGGVAQHGAVPPSGAVLRIVRYRHGGGRAGNVAARTLVVLKTSIPFVGSCENRREARGGIDAESLSAAKQRAPFVLRTRDRAVTAADHELLALEAARDLRRAKCLAVEGRPGVARVLVVPDVGGAPADLRLEQLRPSDETLAAVSTELDRRRIVGTTILVHPPRYQGVTIVARVRARRGAGAAPTERAALDSVYEHLHPVGGGFDGDGWPFGRTLVVAEVQAVLARVPGVEMVEEVLLFAVDVATGERSRQPQPRIELPEDTLLFSVGHQVRVEVAS